MNLNVGQILERVVRRDRMGISELSRKLNVSRRTIYNWFDQQNLDPILLLKIGNIIEYDFAQDLPENFFIKYNHLTSKPEEEHQDELKQVYFWMNKYIHLLEKYNEILTEMEGRQGILNHTFHTDIKKQRAVS